MWGVVGQGGGCEQGLHSPVSLRICATENHSPKPQHLGALTLKADGAPGKISSLPLETSVWSSEGKSPGKLELRVTAV